MLIVHLRYLKTYQLLQHRRTGFGSLLWLFTQDSNTLYMPGELLSPHQASSHRIQENKRFREAAGLKSTERAPKVLLKVKFIPFFWCQCILPWADLAARQLEPGSEVALARSRKLGSKCIYCKGLENKA